MVAPLLIQAAEHNLTGPLLDLVTALLTLGEELLARLASFGQTIRLQFPGSRRCSRSCWRGRRDWYI